MKSPFFLITLLVGMLAGAGQGALGQEATPLPPPPGVGNAGSNVPAGPQMPGSPAAPAGADAGIGPALPPGSVEDGRACKRTVTVEGIPYTWDKLERDTDVAWKAYSDGEYTKSVPIFEKLAKIGHPVAESLMGFVYFYGQGVPQDYQTALNWFEKAAMQGCFEAYALVAQMYEQGLGTAADPGQAYTWFNIAAGQLPQGKDRRDMVARREKVAEAMTPAQIEAAQKRSLQFEPKLVVPPDISELPEDFFLKR